MEYRQLGRSGFKVPALSLGTGTFGGSNEFFDRTEWSDILAAAGITDPAADVYAEITRTSGDDTFIAYGVVNDNVTSDGSFVKMIRLDTDVLPYQPGPLP